MGLVSWLCGGGFYDRTLEVLLSKRNTIAIGFAFLGQETDQPLDFIVTELGVIEIRAR
jgi:5-formyltetrahydrofolate cyclo-ligase